MQTLQWDQLGHDSRKLLFLANQAASRSTCAGQSVGAALRLSDGSIAIGWNTQPAGMPHCSVRGYCNQPGHTCQTDPSPSRAIHAETMAYGIAAQMEAGIAESSLYVTHRPCLSCLKLAVAMGTESITWLDDPYPEDFEWSKVIRLIAVQTGLRDE